MSLPILSWDIYEIRSSSASLNGIKLRGRIRKLCLQLGRNVLVENTEDQDNGVRFAVPSGEEPWVLIGYLKKIIPDAQIEKVLSSIRNPVLSKLKVNDESRYALTQKITDVSRLLTQGAGDTIKINSLLLEILRADQEIGVDDNHVARTIGKSFFMAGKDQSEYYLFLPQEAGDLLLHRIKRAHISTPWEFETLEVIPVTSIEVR